MLLAGAEPGHLQDAGLMAFIGPGYLVAVGYMDPGNWATALAGGSAFGYTLLSVALLSSLMAILLQALCARIGLATGRDLAQLCRERFLRWVGLPLWFLAEIAPLAPTVAVLSLFHTGAKNAAL